MQRRTLGFFGQPLCLDSWWLSGVWALSSSWSWGGYQGGLGSLVVALAGWSIWCLTCRNVCGAEIGVRVATPVYGVGRRLLGITATLGGRNREGGAPCR